MTENMLKFRSEAPPLIINYGKKLHSFTILNLQFGESRFIIFHQALFLTQNVKMQVNLCVQCMVTCH